MKIETEHEDSKKQNTTKTKSYPIGSVIGACAAKRSNRFWKTKQNNFHIPPLPPQHKVINKHVIILVI